MRHTDARRRSGASLPHALCCALASVALSGCGGTHPPQQTVESAALQGTVSAGTLPVSSAHIALFVTNSAGYSGVLSPVATAQADTSGNWVIHGTFTCPVNQQAYVIATGGNPGLASGTDNSAIFLVAALGPCADVSGETVVALNEITTVAAAYALAGFAPAGGNGMTEAAVVGAESVPGITTSPTNIKGLTDAFANAINLADTSVGVAYTVTPSTSHGVVPQTTLNSLANILQSCSITASATSAACTKLFSDATPPASTGIAAPVNIFQAALDLARFPGNNAAALFTDITTSPAYTPALTAAPNDWTVGLVYTSSNIVSASGLAVDASDNVWVAGAGYLLSYSPQGNTNTGLTGNNLLTGFSNITANDTLREIVFDKSGNVFVTDGNYTGVYEYAPSTSTLTALNFDVAPTNDPNANTYGIALDAQGDVFTASYSKSGCATAATECSLVEFPTGGAYTPTSTFGGFTATQPSGALGGARGIAFDVHTGNLWYTAIDDNLGGLITLTPSATGPATATAAAKTLTGFGPETGVPATNTAYGTISVAVDAASRAWFVVAGGPAVTKSGSVTAEIPAALYPVSSTGVVGTGVTGGGLNAAATVVIDGRNTLFVANGGSSATTSSVVEYSPAQGAFLSPNIGLNPGATYASGALTGGSLYEPSYLAIDRSGALWVLSSGSGSGTKLANFVQILGVAAPTDPLPENGNYGVLP